MDTSQVTSTLRCNYQLVLARAIPMLGSLSETSAVGISANRIQNILANTHLEDPGEQNHSFTMIFSTWLHLVLSESVFSASWGSQNWEKRKVHFLQMILYQMIKMINPDQISNCTKSASINSPPTHLQDLQGQPPLFFYAHVFCWDLWWYRYSPSTSPNLTSDF